MSNAANQRQAKRSPSAFAWLEQVNEKIKTKYSPVRQLPRSVHPENAEGNALRKAKMPEGPRREKIDIAPVKQQEFLQEK